MKEQGRGYRWSEAQYLDFERHAENKHEYRDGEVVAVPPCSINHSRLMVGLGARLHQQLQDTSHEAMMGQMRVRVPDGSFYAYPDVLVVGEPICTDAEDDTLTNPIVIVEILAAETEVFDRKGKFDNYKQIPTLRDYVLIEQDFMAIYHHSRAEDGQHWWLRVLSQPDEELILDSIGCHLKLSEIYNRVQFDEPQDEPESDDSQTT